MLTHSRRQQQPLVAEAATPSNGKVSRVPEAHKYTALVAALGLNSTDDLNDVKAVPRAALLYVHSFVQTQEAPCAVSVKRKVFRELVTIANDCLAHNETLRRNLVTYLASRRVKSFT